MRSIETKTGQQRGSPLISIASFFCSLSLCSKLFHHSHREPQTVNLPLIEPRRTSQEDEWADEEPVYFVPQKMPSPPSKHTYHSYDNYTHKMIPLERLSEDVC